MLFIRRRLTIADSGVLNGMTDWHCHILPGVDDGFQKMEDSLTALDRYQEAGIREVWLTPHIMEDQPNTTAELQERFEELKAAYHGRVSLHLAAEYMMDSLFEERLDAGDLLPLGEEGNRLLVETSYFNPPARMAAILSSIRSRGYFPVLAHPERYIYMTMQHYLKLSEDGVRMQLNLPSLAGLFGKEIQKKARLLLRNGYYELCGTDLHRLSQLDRILTAPCLNSTESRILTERFNKTQRQ